MLKREISWKDFRVYSAGVLFFCILNNDCLWSRIYGWICHPCQCRSTCFETSLTLEHRRVTTPFFLKNRLWPRLHIEHIFRSFFFSFFFNLLLDWNTREHSAAVCFHDYLNFLCEMCFWGKIGKKNVQLTKNWQEEATWAKKEGGSSIKLYDETETWWAFQSHRGYREKGTKDKPLIDKMASWEGFFCLILHNFCI